MGKEPDLPSSRGCADRASRRANGSPDCALPPLQAHEKPISILDCTVPGVTRDAQTEFLRFFDSCDWTSTELGARSSWTPLLQSMVSLMLLSPIPILMCWGPRLVCLHNEPFGKRMRFKSKSVLGRPYEEAFGETRCSSTAMQIRRAFMGEGSQENETLLWLRTGEEGRLDETYVSYNDIPIRDEHGVIQGVWIPNVDATDTVYQKRRVRILEDLREESSDKHSYQEYWTGVARAVRKDNTADFLPCIAVYSQQARSEEWHLDEGKKWPSCKEARFDRMRRRESEASSSVGASLELVIRQNANNFPMSVSHRFVDADLEHATSAEELLEAALEKLETSEEDFLVVDSEKAKLFWGDSSIKNVHSDDITHAVIFATRATLKSQVGNLFVFGVTQRKVEKGGFQNALRLFAGTIADGLDKVQLIVSQLDQAHYRAWLANQQRAELADALERRTQELLKEQAQRAQVIAVLPCGLFRADAQVTIVDINPMFTAMTSLTGKPSRDALVSKIAPEYRLPFSQFWDRHSTKITRAASVSTNDSRRSSLRPSNESFLFRWEDADDMGHARWCECILVQEFEQDGQLSWLVGTLNDVSERVHAEEYEKQRANDAVERRLRLNRFVDVLSHELRNPMSAISSCVELALDRLHRFQDESEGDGEARGVVQECAADLDTVNFCLTHMRRLVDDTLNLSRLEHDFLLLDLKAFQPRTLLQDAIRICSAEHQMRQIRCELELGEGFDEHGAHWLVSDPTKVLQICVNLLSNSTKFSRTNEPTIRVRADVARERPSGSHWRLSDDAPSDDPTKHLSSPDDERAFLVVTVRDNGIGISAEEQQALFERFSQGAVTSRYYGGSGGLGLFVCRRMAEMLGGACGLDSVHGQGSTFSFYVETTIGQAPPSPPRSTPASPLLPPIGSSRRSPPTSRVEQLRRAPSVKLPSADVPPKSPPPSSGVLLPALPSSGAATPVSHLEREAICQTMKVVALHSPDLDSAPGTNANSPKVTSTPYFPPASSTTTTSSSRGNSDDSTTPTTASRPLHALLVEDNIINARMLEKQLIREGVRVTCAENGLVCLERLDAMLSGRSTEDDDAKFFDIVLMDVEMPHMNGIEATKRIRENGLPIAILGVSANARQEQIEEMLDAGMDDVQTKPFQIKNLMSKITALTSSSDAGRS